MTVPPVRTVEANLLTSTDLPSIKIKVDERLRYIGRRKFILYDIAEAEVFVFAEADPDRRLMRWLVVQFEGYLPGNNHTYNYAMPTRLKLGPHEYMVDEFAANMRKLMEQRREGSDGAQVADLLRQANLEMPDGAVWVRFVRMLDEARRNELLFIYTEDAEELGLVAADLPVDEPLPPEYRAVAVQLHERAMSRFSIIEG